VSPLAASPGLDRAAVAAGTRFLARLPAYLRNPLTTAEARAVVRQRLELREAAFLEVASRAIYPHPGSPYAQLLRVAGCQEGDLRRLVADRGLEGALAVLFGQGVYLTVDEFKGRRPAVRGSAIVDAGPALLRNPLAAFHVPARTGGSRSSGTRVLMDLAFVRGCAADNVLAFEARNGLSWLKATWETPGAGARFRLLKLASFGAPPVRWFSQVEPSSKGLDTVFRRSDRAMRLGSRLAGVRLPRAEHAPVSDPEPVLRWLQAVLREGSTPFLFAFPSSAVGLCRVALDRSVPLDGVQLTLGGEPITDARLGVVRRAGANAVPRYGSIETGPIGYGCLKPEAADDVHLLEDLHALIQPVGDAPRSGLPSPALFVTSLHPASPFVMLNVSLGDQAAIVRRRCGCPMEEYGWGVHLHSIRSYEKLSVGGMTFLDAGLVRVLEEVLPARFGGTPTDYQLSEEEAPGGEQVLRLLVHPRLRVDTDVVSEAFLAAIAVSSDRAQMIEELWRDAGRFRVERMPPLATRSGKILHLHAKRVDG
jgi:hypothetical protein